MEWHAKTFTVSEMLLKMPDDSVHVEPKVATHELKHAHQPQ